MSLRTLGERRRVRTVRSVIDALNRRELRRLETVFAPDLQINGQPWSYQQMRADVEALIAAFPDLQWHLELCLVEDSLVAVRLHDTGTHVADYRGERGSGARVNAHELLVYRFRGRQVVELWISADQVLLRDRILEPRRRED